jgi:amino acid transporter
LLALGPVTGLPNRHAMGAPDEDVDLASLASSSSNHSRRSSTEASAIPSPRSSLSRLSFSYNDMLVPLTASAEDSTGDARLEKLKSVTFWGGLSLVVGLQIGSGIFSSPALVNRDAGSVGMALIVWIIAGCLAWTGACMFPSIHFPCIILISLVASYAELGSAIPLNGGAYAYIHHIFGPLPAFLFSWISIVALKPGSAAIIAIIFAKYCNRIFFLSLKPNDTTPAWADKIIALVSIWLICGLNALGSKWGTRVNQVLTLLKLIALVAVGIIGIVVLGTCLHALNINGSSSGSWIGEFQTKYIRRHKY